MFKVTLNKGTSYYDPKTNTNLKLSSKTRVFEDEEIERFDMENIEFAVSVGVLLKADAEKEAEEDVKNEKTDEVVNIETDEVLNEDADETQAEEESLEELTDDGDPRCQEITGSGTQCKNAAKYPKEEPKYCGTHKDKAEE